MVGGKMMQIQKRGIFIAKYTIAVIIAAFAGIYISNRAFEFISVNWVPFELAFDSSLSKILLIVGTQWILFDQKLPKSWFATGVIGAVIAAIAHGFVLEAYQYYRYEHWTTILLEADRWFIFAALATFPQMLVIRNKVQYSFWWVISNIVGWNLNSLMYSLFYETAIRPFTLSLPGSASLMLMVTFELPFGILCGIFLYRLTQDFEYEGQKLGS
jgi:hypothetical protein